MASQMMRGGGYGTPTQGWIKNVNGKGFAFAETKNGNSVYIPAPVYQELGEPGRGSQVDLVVERGHKGYFAMMPPPRSSMSWGDWQIGQTQVPIPDTIPGSEHTISFACWKCGKVILEEYEIHRIKQGTVWSTDASMMGSALKTGKQFYNEFKKIRVDDVRCTGCSTSLGQLFKESYHLAEEETLFPCVKLNITRELRKSGGILHNDLVLRARSRRDAKAAVAKLVQVPGFNGKIQMRTTKNTFELKQQVEQAHDEAEQARREAERVRQEAQARAQSAAEEVNAAKAKTIEEQKLRKRAEDKANRAAAVAARALAAAEEADDPRQWSCEEGDGRYVPYDALVNDKIEAAFNPMDPASSVPVEWEDRGFRYRIDWEVPVQVNTKTGTARLIKYEAATKKPMEGSTRPWSTPGETLANGTKRHTILASSVADGSETRELQEFNFAYAQMKRLLTGREIQINKIDVYESPSVERNYEAKRLAMHQSSERWVFHGSGYVEKIATGGFKVGGQAGVPVIHGARYGHGVYTATGPNTPMGSYARGNCVILAKALEGVRGAQEASDCWAPKLDWLVFKTGEQLLPKYVVHWG